LIIFIINKQLRGIGYTGPLLIDDNSVKDSTLEDTIPSDDETHTPRDAYQELVETEHSYIHSLKVVIGYLVQFLFLFSFFFFLFF